MKLIKLVAAAAVPALSAIGAQSAEYQIDRTLQLSAPAADTWQRVGDFCDVDDWHPALKGCTLKVIDGSLHRVLTTEEGAELVQKRIAAEPGLSYTYRLVSSPLPVEKYTATFSIAPTGGSLISWSVRFTSDDPTAESEIAEMLETGLAAMESALANK